LFTGHPLGSTASRLCSQQSNWRPKSADTVSNCALSHGH